MSALAKAEMLVALSADAGDAPAWVHLMPLGEFRGRDGRGPWRLDDPQSVVMASRDYAGRRQMPVDYEHQTLLVEKNGKPAPAAGWIDGLQVRPNGIWGRVSWTARARAHLVAREYRYLSPVFTHDPDGRVTRLVNAALTNHPALDELTALARAEQPVDPSMEALLTKLRTMLGLAADASEEAIIAAIGALQTASASATPDPAQFVPIGELERAVTEVNRLNKGITQAAAVQHVETQIRAGNLPPTLREWGVSLCTVNKTAFDSFVERTRGAFNRIIDPKAIQTRETGKRPPDLDDDALAVCRRMGITPEELVAARAFNGNETTGA